jgi:outer membrane murein-binding lipoprotein Lpp
MTLDELLKPAFLLDLVQVVAIVALWLRKPGEDAGAKADAVARLVKDIAGRVDVLEERMKHMPSSTELADLEGTVKAINAKLDGMHHNQEAVGRTLSRIEDYLLKHQAR